MLTQSRFVLSAAVCILEKKATHYLQHRDSSKYKEDSWPSRAGRYQEKLLWEDLILSYFRINLKQIKRRKTIIRKEEILENNSRKTCSSIILG